MTRAVREQYINHIAAVIRSTFTFHTDDFHQPPLSPPPISLFFPAAHSVVTAGNGGRGSEKSTETGRPEEVATTQTIRDSRQASVATAYDSCSRRYFSIVVFHVNVSSSPKRPRLRSYFSR